MFVVDTNVLVYSADQRAPEHGRCLELLKKWQQQLAPWCLTWGIIYEFLRVSTHPKVFANPLTAGEAWSVVEALMDAPSLQILQATDRHRMVVKEVLEEVPLVAGNLFFDARTAILMKEHGIQKIYTRDTHFHRFSFVEVVDPLV